MNIPTGDSEIGLMGEVSGSIVTGFHVFNHTGAVGEVGVDGDGGGCSEDGGRDRVLGSNSAGA